MPNHPKTVELDSFKGLNNVLPPERTGSEYLKEAMNIDIDKSGGIRKRKGYTKVISGDFHSLWSTHDKSRCFAVKDGDLVEIYSDYTTDIVLSSIGEDKISFEEVDGEIYYITDSITGIISKSGIRSFGLERPLHSPTLSIGIGSLSAGVYQIAVTYIDSDMRESGTGRASQITVGTNQGISLSNIPVSTDSNITGVRIYCTTPNGEVLYLQDTVANGITSYTITGVRESVTPLKSFNIFKAPSGQILRHAHGRMWIAKDNILHYSEPFAYDWWKYSSNFFVFEERIRAVMPTEDGLWVASDRLYYLSGKSPDRMNRSEREPVKVVEGSDIKIPGSYIFIENTPIGYKWIFTTDKGVFVAFNDGIVLNMTEQNVSLPEALDGTGLFIQEGGINRYLSILREKRPSNNTAVGDLVTTTVIRNGIEIT